MPWIVGGAIVGSSLLGANAASDASSAQAGASGQATAEQRRQFDISQANLAPWLNAGTGAINRLGDATQPNGEFMRRFTMQDFLNDPVNQAQGTFMQDEARKAIERRAAAMGGWDSGATLKALTRFGSDYGAQRAGESYNRFVGDQSNQFNRLASIAGVGQTAANQTATLGANAANQIGQNMIGAANARGAAGVAGANAFTGGVNTGLNYYQGQQFLNRLQPPEPQLPSWNNAFDYSPAYSNVS
jgi:hypothetical protein